MAGNAGKGDVTVAITITAALMMMAAYFLLLYGGVAFVQDKRFFSSAPEEVLAAVPERKERFRGAHFIGWVIIVLAFAVFFGAFALAASDGIRRGFGFGRFFIRFLVMLFGMETFDIIFFDWVLLCRSNFFPRYYPQVKGIVGPHLFGYNKKTHIMHYVSYIPVCAVIAWICTRFS